MLSFTTDDLRPQDRFDHWCEVRGKALFGVTIELERNQRPDFRGHFSARAVGGAVVSEMQASSYRISRTNADIARMSGNSLCIGLQVRGPGMLETGRGHRQHVRAGSLTISHSDLPFQATPERSNGFEYRMLKIPLSADLLVGVRGHDLYAAGLAHTAPFARPLEALFTALTHPDAPPADAEGDVVHAARLALVIRGRLAHGSVEGRAALRAGYLHAARQILARDLRRPDLSPDRVAAELGISLRQVHVLFEPTGQSFSRTLTVLRVREAARLLRAKPSRPVADVAFHCGFESLSAFYRAFQGVYGMTPRDLRQSEGETRRALPQAEAAMA